MGNYANYIRLLRVIIKLNCVVISFWHIVCYLTL